MEFEPTSPFPATEPFDHRRGRYGAHNLAVTAAQVLAWAALLTAIDRAPSWWLKAPLILLFCWVMQGVFSMMHEYFHQNAHRDRRVNDLIGVVGATIFGSSATLHRINHWGHHVRNRTSAERGEFIHEGESVLGKVLLYYFATMGGLWLGGLIFPVVSLVIPYRSVAWLKRSKEFNTYAAAFEQFKAEDWTRMRLEGLLLVGFWVLVVASGVWQPVTLLVTYAAMAYHWSVLQWIYHLRTPIDVVEGAYNLRVPAPVRLLWLNFNCNLTHHRKPALPWQELYVSSDMRETQPLWYRYWLMWLPPRRFPRDLSALDKTYF